MTTSFKNDKRTREILDKWRPREFAGAVLQEMLKGSTSDWKKKEIWNFRKKWWAAEIIVTMWASRRQFSLSFFKYRWLLKVKFNHVLKVCICKLKRLRFKS